MGHALVSGTPAIGREVIPASTVGKTMTESLHIVMGWERAELPGRFAIASGSLRRLTTRVREQPVNFLIVAHQSVETARGGQSQSRVGSKAVMVLLGEDSERHSDAHRKEFTTTTLRKIKESASDLDNRANDMLSKYRLLRTTLTEIHNDLIKVTNKRERSAFLAPLSRLSKDVRDSENALKKVLEKIDDIENSLNLVIKWWQTIEADVDYLQTLGDSPLLDAKNTVTLHEINKGFLLLDNYFAEYCCTMRQIYDINATKLNISNKEYLEKVRDCTNLVLSKLGRLEPRQN